MADTLDPKKDNKDAESGEPVQLDPEQQGGEPQPAKQPGQAQPRRPQGGAQPGQ